MTPIRLLIHGASGRMGQSLLRLAAADSGLHVVAAVSRGGADDASGSLPASRMAEAPAFDVAIDFSLPAGLAGLIDACARHGAGLVSGTTGLGSPEHAALDAAAARIPLLWAPNFSLGVAVLQGLVRQAAAALPGWDADIIELHHSGKRDAPSGTALRLGEALAAGRGQPPRYHSLRAGDAVGEHSVQLSGHGERLELVHRASDREVFARGALFVAGWLAGKAPGRYRIEDALAGPKTLS